VATTFVLQEAAAGSKKGPKVVPKQPSAGK
jgi:hypothetical protein